MNPKVARAMRAAHRQFADGGDVQDNRSMFGRAADTAMDYAGRGLALGDLYTGGILSSLAGLNPFTSYGSVMEARERALAGVPRDAKALATEPINPVALGMAAIPKLPTRIPTIVKRIGNRLDKGLWQVGVDQSRRSKSQYLTIEPSEDWIWANDAVHSELQEILPNPYSRGLYEIRVSDHQNPASRMWRQSGPNDRAQTVNTEIRADNLDAETWESIINMLDDWNKRGNEIANPLLSPPPIKK